MGKSFCVDPKTKKISIYAGDTASMTAKIRGYDYGGSDRALFTVGEKDGDTVIEKCLEITDNQVVVHFQSEDTNQLDPELDYEWDLRFIVNPQYGEDGKVINRDDVSTPPDGPFCFKVKKTVGHNV